VDATITRLERAAHALQWIFSTGIERMRP
jgi:hypothetical protein